MPRDSLPSYVSSPNIFDRCMRLLFLHFCTRHATQSTRLRRDFGVEAWNLVRYRCAPGSGWGRLGLGPLPAFEGVP